MKNNALWLDIFTQNSRSKILIKKKSNRRRNIVTYIKEKLSTKTNNMLLKMPCTKLYLHDKIKKKNEN